MCAVVVVAKLAKRFLLLVDFLYFLLGRDLFLLLGKEKKIVVILLNFYGEMLL